MKCKDIKGLLNVFIKEAENPKELIYSIMNLQKQTVSEIASLSKMSKAHFYVTMNHLEKGVCTMNTCVRLAKALDIDSYILYRIISDYQWKCFMKKQEDNN